jgi:phasin
MQNIIALHNGMPYLGCMELAHARAYLAQSRAGSVCSCDSRCAMTTAKSAKSASRSASAAFEAFNFQAPAFDVPSAFRDFAEKSVESARDNYAKMKTAAEDATSLLEGTMETARQGAFAIGAKALDAAKSNSDASFAHAKDLFGVKSVSELIELQSSFARQQFEAMTVQFRDFQALTEKFVADTTKPVTEKVEKTLKEMNVA